MPSATSAMPQFSEQLVSVVLMVSRVATAMLEGISLSPLKWKSGSATAGAARSEFATPWRSATRAKGSAGAAALSKTRTLDKASARGASRAEGERKAGQLGRERRGRFCDRGM